MNRKQTIVVQIHQAAKIGNDRAVDVLRQLIESLVPRSDWSCTSDPEEGWLNLQFESKHVGSTWARVLEELTKDADAFENLKQRWIVVAQGSHGWKDYRVIAHHDSSVQIEKLS